MEKRQLLLLISHELSEALADLVGAHMQQLLTCGQHAKRCMRTVGYSIPFLLYASHFGPLET